MTAAAPIRFLRTLRAAWFFSLTLVGIWSFATMSVAQSLPAESVQTFLPPDAKIIETADLTAVAGKPRELVLWMIRPRMIELNNLDDGTCRDIFQGFGSFWEGPARLSLIDMAGKSLINTVEIREHWSGQGPGQDEFQLPLCVLDPYSEAATSKAQRKREGKPNLNLRDFTGEGVKAQFALFVFEAFGIADTSVFGYDQHSDRIVQYSVEILRNGQKPRTEVWVEQIFGKKPLRPGFWDFTWNPGHGADVTFHEQVSFDRARQLFVEKQESAPYKGASGVK